MPKPEHLVVFVIAAHALSSPPAAHAQPADPTAIKLTPRVLEVDDPDALLKSAANDVINTVVLPQDRKLRLVALSFEILDQSLQEFNRLKYGTATAFLKGGLALYIHYYNGGVRNEILRVSQSKAGQCDAAFTASDIDYNVTTHWKSVGNYTGSPYDFARDTWLTGSAELEYGYETLNDRVLFALESIRTHLYKDRTDILVPDGKSGTPESVKVGEKGSVLESFNNDFLAEKTRSPAFLRKWADFLAANIRWTDVIITNDPVSYSHRMDEYPDQDDTQAPELVVKPRDENGKQDEDRMETLEDQVAEVRNITLPDRVMLPGPNLHLLYTHRRGTGLHSVYITSNYSQVWPSDPSIDPERFTKFALHRLKLVLPFRYVFSQPDTMTKPISKIKRHSLEVFLRRSEEEDGDTTAYTNLFGVGGELVDVGVDHPIASFSHPPVDPNTLVPLTLKSELGTGNINVMVAGRDWLLHDLKDALFDVVGLPWKKKKADKRLVRFLCMTYPTMAPRKSALADYVACLRDASKSSIRACVAKFPQDLDGTVKDFFVGASVDHPETGYSLYSIMSTLPESEYDAAQAYLNNIYAFLVSG